MADKEFILKLMYVAFIDIRIASQARDSHTCFALADIFHNVPLQMIKADKGEIKYEDILIWINNKCVEKQCLHWLNNAEGNIKNLP